MNSIFLTKARLGGKLGVALGVALVLSACSMGSLLGPNKTATTANAGALANAQTPQSEINMDALAAVPAIATECPPIKVRAGSEAIYSYKSNRVGDANSLEYEAVIDKQSRSCIASNSKITVEMGVLGRVLLGPAGNPGNYTIPVRFAVERDDLVVYSEKFDLPVTVGAGAGSQDFYKVVDGVEIPFVGGENTVIWVGFDSKS